MIVTFCLCPSLYLSSLYLSCAQCTFVVLYGRTDFYENCTSVLHDQIFLFESRLLDFYASTKALTFRLGAVSVCDSVLLIKP